MGGSESPLGCLSCLQPGLATVSLRYPFLLLHEIATYHKYEFKINILNMSTNYLVIIIIT